MIKGFALNDTEDYIIEHLYDSPETEELIAKFSVKEENAGGLENYLKLLSFADEDNKNSRTYIIKDKETNELAGYFSLKTGLITYQISPDSEMFESVPAIELSNFAVNSIYKENHPEISKLGTSIFYSFIFPLAKQISNYVGVNSLYIYALPNNKLIEHYKTMGFHRLSPKNEAFVQSHVKPKYDEDCIFMYQTL